MTAIITERITPQAKRLLVWASERGSFTAAESFSAHRMHEDRLRTPLDLGLLERFNHQRNGPSFRLTDLGREVAATIVREAQP